MQENSNRTIYIKNNHQKYKSKRAYRIRDENKFLEQLLDDIRNNKPFLFASDSNDSATKLCAKCLKHFPQLKDKIILITKDTNFRVKNANEDFKDKFVFYSPKIVFGVDFNIDVAQNVYLYIKGRTLTPYDLYQQATRTRNIKDIYVYCECCEIHILCIS